MVRMKLMTLTAMCTFAPETGLIARPHPASQSSDLKGDDVESTLWTDKRTGMLKMLSIKIR